jgi:hypothetical protein
VKKDDIVKYALLAAAGYLVYANWDKIVGSFAGDSAGADANANVGAGATNLIILTPSQQAQVKAAQDLGQEVVGIHPEGGYVMVADRSVSTEAVNALRMSRIGDPTGVTTRGGGGTTGRGGSGGGSMRALDYNSITGGSWS